MAYCFTSLTPTTAKQDSANELWNMYLDEVKDEDQRISDAWKEDSNGILVFVSPNILIPFVSLNDNFQKTGLFSATVGAFIIEFYKTLSPDYGNQTIALLGQISQQLADSPNGTHSIMANQPFSPSVSMIWVNAMWLISLVLSLTSALIATLLQQWARRYVEMPHRPSEPNHRARVRSFLFHGAELYKMRFAAQIAPTLLHFAVYLFFAGLVILFNTIDKNVAIAVDVSVGVFAVAYIVLSILPCIDAACPYRTPMSYILWYPLHAILSSVALFLRWFVEQIHGCLVQPNMYDENVTPGQRLLVGWLESHENAVKTHWRYFIDGLGKSIINCAINTQGNGDRKIVTRLFNLALSDKNKLQKLAARIPRGRVLELIPLIESGRIVLGDPLAILLRSCTASACVAGPDEDVRKRSLLVCLDVIHHIAKAPCVPDLNSFRAKFADIRLMRTLWDDRDPSIRFTSRSICALLAKKVVREDSELDQSRRLWLYGITGEAPGTIQYADIVRRDHMNLKSFVYGVLSDQVGDLPTESFKETLATLLNVGTDVNLERDHSQICLSDQVRWIQREDPQGCRKVVDQLCSMFPFLPPPPSPPPSTPPPPPLPAGAVPSHSGMPFVDPYSLLTALPSIVTVPLSVSQSAHSNASNVPFGL